MITICFPTKIKYNDVWYQANTPFNIKDDDLAELQKKGCWVVKNADTKQVKQEVTETIQDKSVDKKKGKD